MRRPIWTPSEISELTGIPANQVRQQLEWRGISLTDHLRVTQWLVDQVLRMDKVRDAYERIFLTTSQRERIRQLVAEVMEKDLQRRGRLELFGVVDTPWSKCFSP